MTSVDNPSSFLYTLSRNFIIDFLRKKVFTTSNTEYLLNYFQCDSATPQEKAEYKELDNLLKKAVDTLPGKLKEVFTLSRTNGLTHEQIARALGISVVTSKTYIVRALQHIRAYLDEHSETGLVLLFLALLTKS